METMRAYVFRGINEIRIEEVTARTPVSVRLLFG